MFFFANIMLMFLNLGLTVGLVIGALILLRPLRLCYQKWDYVSLLVFSLR
jgi:hypothetical protein